MCVCVYLYIYTHIYPTLCFQVTRGGAASSSSPVDATEPVVAEAAGFGYVLYLSIYLSILKVLCAPK